MLRAYCQHDLAKQHVTASLAGLLAVVAFWFWSPSAAAQACVVQPPSYCATLNVCPGNAPLASRQFNIHDLGGGRCIDAGPPQDWDQGSRVFINACNQTVGQKIQATEIDGSSHDVGLAVYPTAPGTTTTGTTTGGFCIGVHGGTVAPGATLELQTCNASSPAQRFAVDGDAILMGSQPAGVRVSRDFVIERQNGSTVPQTPLVVATRNLGEEVPLRIDARYFLFNAVDGSGAAPTSGFLKVKDGSGLVCAAQCGWGTVVQIDASQDLVLTNPLPSNITVADGTTIRGYRSQIFNGPEILTCVAPQTNSLLAGDSSPVFLATGQGVRFTGFRLHGPNGDSRCESIANKASESAIEVSRPDSPGCMPSVWVDHMEISHWPDDAGILIADPNPNAQPNPSTPPRSPDTPAALAVGNFLHDNQYGVNSGGALFSQIRATVFYNPGNQPIASREDGCLGGYAAVDNLLLPETASGSPSSDDVDMHGSLNPHHWTGGLAGDYFDVGWNTFLKTDKTIWPIGVYGKFIANVNQRGYSCRFTEIHNNVFLQSQGDAITQDYNAPVLYNNIVNAQNPTQGPLLVGDFDGDKIDDVFLATGATWYYSSGGQAEWRYLNRASDPAKSLLLGDFDGDGRTDVLAVHGPNIEVSWAGVSAWQTINQTAWPLGDLAVGDFDGNGRSDLLLATGTQWFLASGGQNWRPWAGPDTDTIPNLRFGHFTDKTKTQILRVQNQSGIRRWQVTEWGMSSWTDLPGEAPVDSLTGLVAGDFDGQGYTELARSTPQWQYTSPGRGNSWSPLGTSSNPIQTLPIGNFQGGAQDGVITWPDSHFYFTHACTTYYSCPQSQPQVLSRQPMR